MDAERLRLIERGVEVSVPLDNRKEGYREVRLHDPDRKYPDLVRVDRFRTRESLSPGIDVELSFVSGQLSVVSYPLPVVAWCQALPLISG